MHCTTLRRFGTVMLMWLAATAAIAEEANFLSLTYSPWNKICLGDSCFIGRDGRSNVNCDPVVAAVLIEQNRGKEKALRVTLPRGVNLERGVRMIIDQGQAMERPYVNCFANGCMADYSAGAALVDQLKLGRTLSLEAFDKANLPINLTLPLFGFADAYDGPSQETKVLEKVFSSKEEMQADSEREKRAQEERKARCEVQQVR